MSLKSVIASLVYSNLWISIGAASMAWMYYEISGTKVSYVVLLFLFFSTLVTYTFQRFIKLHQKESVQGPRIEWMKKNSLFVRILMITALVGACVFGMYLHWHSILFLTGLATISFLYAYKFKLFRFKTNLRDLPAVKIFLIGSVWALSTVLLPAIQARSVILTTCLVLIGYFLLIIAITIPFDIRDIDVDEKSKKTIPQLTGSMISKIIATILLLLSYLFLVGELKLDLGLLFGFFITTILIILSKPERNELFYSFIMDGLLLLIPILYYFLSGPEFVPN